MAPLVPTTSVPRSALRSLTLIPCWFIFLLLGDCGPALGVVRKRRPSAPGPQVGTALFSSLSFSLALVLALTLSGIRTEVSGGLGWGRAWRQRHTKILGIPLPSVASVFCSASEILLHLCVTGLRALTFSFPWESSLLGNASLPQINRLLAWPPPGCLPAAQAWARPGCSLGVPGRVPRRTPGTACV